MMQMTEQTQFPWDSIIPLVGVLIGFFLSQVAESIKNYRRKKIIKNAVLHELEIIKETLSDAKKNGNKVSKEKFPFITEIFDSNMVELASFLKPDQTICLVRAYKQIKKLNTPEEKCPTGYFQVVGDEDYHFFSEAIDGALELVEKAIAKLSG